MIYQACGLDKKIPRTKFSEFFGRGRRTRTHDPWFWRPVLYQLSYTPTNENIILNFIAFVKMFLKNILIFAEIYHICDSLRAPHSSVRGVYMIQKRRNSDFTAATSSYFIICILFQKLIYNTFIQISILTAFLFS